MRKLFPQGWFILTVGQQGFCQTKIRLKVNQSGLIPHHNIHAIWIFFNSSLMDCFSELFLELTSIKVFLSAVLWSADTSSQNRKLYYFSWMVLCFPNYFIFEMVLSRSAHLSVQNVVFGEYEETQKSNWKKYYLGNFTDSWKHKDQSFKFTIIRVETCEFRNFYCTARCNFLFNCFHLL